MGSCAIFKILRTLTPGCPCAGNSSLVGSRRVPAPIPAGTHQLLIVLNHVHGNTDSARLIGNGARDGPGGSPGRIGRKLVAAAPLELVDRFHQARLLPS